MVHITDKPPVTPVSHSLKTQVSEVESHTDERRANPRPKPLVERRKQPDRRRNNGKRSLYDMRTNRGRRKTDRGGHSAIDVDA